MPKTASTPSKFRNVKDTFNRATVIRKGSKYDKVFKSVRALGDGHKGKYASQVGAGVAAATAVAKAKKK